MKTQMAESGLRPEAEAAEGTVCVGDVIAAAFDEASSVTGDRGEAERLATVAVLDLLRAAHRVLPGGARPPRARQLAG